MSTISDRKVPVDDVNNNILYFLPDVDTYQDYFPFGMVMSERSGSEGSAGYRYGFNGMEYENELYQPGNAYDFGARVYDGRIGRWFSVDPMAAKQPGWSSYKSFLNNPVMYIDPEGETEFIAIITINQETGKTIVELKTANRVMTDGKKIVKSRNGCHNYQNYYYDFTTVVLRTVDSEGNIISEEKRSEIIKGDPKGYENVWFGGDEKGDTKIENRLEWLTSWSPSGGIRFTTNLNVGGNNEGREGNDAVESINIDGLMAVLGSASRAAGSKNLDNLADPFKNLFDMVSAGMDFTDAVMQTVDGVDEMAESSKDLKVCNDCNRVLSKFEEDTHNTLGKGTRDTTITSEN